MKDTYETKLGCSEMHCTDQDTAINNTKELTEKHDEQLVSALQAGLPEAFAELYATYSRRLYKEIVAITRNHQDAEDALQETFLRAHLKLHTFESRSSICTWLTRIAVNSALMILRRRRTRPETLFDPDSDARTDTLAFEIRDSASDPEQICDLRQRRVKVLHAIRRLDPKLQTPIRMRVTLGSSVEEIGRALNISEAAVKTRLYRARRRLLTARDLRPLGPLHKSGGIHEIAGQAIIAGSDRS